MMRNLAARFLLVLACFAHSPAAHAGSDPVVLTVTGNVAKPNRGPLDPFEDAVLAHLEAKFDKGFTFTLAELRSLPQKTVTARYAEWPRDVTATGPELGAVLKAASAEGKKILVQAVDGYAPEFTADDVARGKMILAVEADGKPLPLGGRGPLWLFGPKDSFAGQESEEGFVFAVIRIDVQ
jgi:hypothetical protein